MATINGMGWHLGGSAQAVALTGTTDKTVLASVSIPAGTIATNARLEVYTLWSFTGSTNAKTKFVELGSTAFMEVATTGGTSVILGRNTVIFARGRASQVSMVKTAASGLGAQTSAVTTGTENLDSALLLKICGQLASGSETLTLEAWDATLWNP